MAQERARIARAGGFLVEDGPAASLNDAIRAVASGEAVVAPRVTRRLLDRTTRLDDRPTAHRPARNRPTCRRPDAPRALTQGPAERAEIAAEPVVSKATVKTHIAHVPENSATTSMPSSSPTTPAW
ncbi:hypothetical protein ACFVTC_36930 [Streptomyces sp. NPDC057950]|uniref:hypothetical protein n=1 Tax=Streptomyces sp. NPDC057950 TaxID=3346288 RepID=UPI0036ED9D46